MSSISDFLFQGQPTPAQPTGSDTSTAYPLRLQQFVYNTANAATNLANTPFTPFPGPTVAGPSSATQEAWDKASGNVGNYQPLLNQAGALTQAAGQSISPDQINAYMDPYINTVIGGLQSAANTNLFQNILPSVQDRFVSAGQSRSPQEMQATNNAIYQSNQALDQATAGALGQGWSGALSAAQADAARKQAAGAQFGQLGALTQQLGAADVGQLAASGQAQDVFNQNNINAALQQFQAQQQWPYQNRAYASNIIRGLPVNTTQQTVGTTYATPGATASPLASFVGTTLGAGAIGSSLGNAALQLRRGGRVRRLATGGALSRMAA